MKIDRKVLKRYNNPKGGVLCPKEEEIITGKTILVNILLVSQSPIIMDRIEPASIAQLIFGRSFFMNKQMGKTSRSTSNRT